MPRFYPPRRLSVLQTGRAQPLTLAVRPRAGLWLQKLFLTPDLCPKLTPAHLGGPSGQPSASAGSGLAGQGPGPGLGPRGLGPLALRSRLGAAASWGLGVPVLPGLDQGRPRSKPGPQGWAGVGVGAGLRPGRPGRQSRVSPGGHRPQHGGPWAGGPWRLERQWGAGRGGEGPRRRLFPGRLCGHGRVPEGGEDWRGHLWGGVQGQEQGDGAACGPQEDQAGSVSAGTAAETPSSGGDPQPQELPLPVPHFRVLCSTPGYKGGGYGGTALPRWTPGGDEQVARSTAPCGRGCAILRELGTQVTPPPGQRHPSLLWPPLRCPPLLQGDRRGPEHRHQRDLPAQRA